MYGGARLEPLIPPELDPAAAMHILIKLSRRPRSTSHAFVVSAVSGAPQRRRCNANINKTQQSVLPTHVCKFYAHY